MIATRYSRQMRSKETLLMHCCWFGGRELSIVLEKLIIFFWFSMLLMKHSLLFYGHTHYPLTISNKPTFKRKALFQSILKYSKCGSHLDAKSICAAIDVREFKSPICSGNIVWYLGEGQSQKLK